MTTIDVNTGAYVGHRNLEETIFRTNLEAAVAIARQLRLRNLGGIIIIDFIDMEEEEHRRQVLQALEKALASDHAKTHISAVSPLGLVEMTRKRTRESLEHLLCEPCPACEGRGFVKTAETVCYEIFREILRQARQFDFQQLLVLAHQDVIERLLDEESAALAELEVPPASPSACRPKRCTARPVRRGADVTGHPVWRVVADRAGLLVIVALILRRALRDRPGPRQCEQKLALGRAADAMHRIRGLDARLRWFGPEVVLRGMRVLERDGSEALIAAREGSVGLDLWNFFRTGELVAGRVRFARPDAHAGPVRRWAHPSARAERAARGPRPSTSTVCQPAGRSSTTQPSTYRDLATGTTPVTLTEIERRVASRAGQHRDRGLGQAARTHSAAASTFAATCGARSTNSTHLDARHRAQGGPVDWPVSALPAGPGGQAAEGSARPRGLCRSSRTGKRLANLRLGFALRDVVLQLPRRAVPRSRPCASPTRRLRTPAGNKMPLPDGDQDDRRPRAAALADRGPLRNPRRRCPTAT